MIGFHEFKRTLAIGLCSIVLSAIIVSQQSWQKASFALKNEHTQTEFHFSSEKENYIVAKKYGNYLWVRFAETAEKEGSYSDHLDIDIWNYAGPGTYLPANLKANKREGKQWNIWWHGEGAVYVNQANAKDCDLIITEQEGELFGRFSCQNLKLNNGNRSINIKNGSFNVTPVPGETK